MSRTAPLRFIVVGCAAALTHWLVASFAMGPLMAWPALIANVLGFSVAFWVSYAGHHRWTFRSDAPHGQAIWRFALVAIGSFVLNEAMFAALLRWTPLPPRLSLALVLVAVAGLTYLLGRRWAFVRSVPA